ncbi:MAG: Clp protease ClpP [Amaricoccus sp.]
MLAALGEFEDDEAIVVHINSGGGYATEGAAIRAALADRAGRTDIFVEGIAASAASLIAMAGEAVTMATDAVLMIHDPSGFTFGTAADHEATVRALNSLAGAYARSYARKSGKPVAECRGIMQAETWFNAAEALEAGFADAIEGEAEPVAAFPYQTYAHAPQRLVALAKENGWRAPAVRTAASAAKPAAASAAPRGHKEESMTDKTKADDQAAALETARAEAAAGAVKSDRERRAAVMALEEAKGREALAEHLYATTEMSAEQIKATLAAAPKAADDKPAEDYERARLAGTGLGGSPKAAPVAAADGWKAAAAKINARR